MGTEFFFSVDICAISVNHVIVSRSGNRRRARALTKDKVCELSTKELYSLEMNRSRRRRLVCSCASFDPN